jgi:manganese/iron transport system ATP-binding protein
MSEDNLIVLDDVGVTYPNGYRALEHVSVAFPAGIIAGLVGMNGAGKSTLFKAMMGFVRPTAGRISIAGGAVRDALRRNLVAYVPQSEDVDWNFPVLVEDVVMMGRYGHMGFLRRPRAADRTAVEDALARVGMADFRKRQIGELSGGQKKRVFVARALAQEARVILLDEPFTGVDVKTEAALIDLLRALAGRGALIVVSTHNLGNVPRFCDRVVLINRTLVAAGATEDVFTEGNLARAFGGMLRHVRVGGADLHDDADRRGVTVLTDDEHPVVLYGEEGGQKIVRDKREGE